MNILGTTMIGETVAERDAMSTFLSTVYYERHSLYNRITALCGSGHAIKVTIAPEVKSKLKEMYVELESIG